MNMPEIKSKVSTGFAEPNVQFSSSKGIQLPKPNMGIELDVNPGLKRQQSNLNFGGGKLDVNIDTPNINMGRGDLSMNDPSVKIGGNLRAEQPNINVGGSVGGGLNTGNFDRNFGANANMNLPEPKLNFGIEKLDVNVNHPQLKTHRDPNKIEGNLNMNVQQPNTNFNMNVQQPNTHLSGNLGGGNVGVNLGGNHGGNQGGNFNVNVQEPKLNFGLGKLDVNVSSPQVKTHRVVGGVN